jgi:hypothetical protein
MMEFVHNWIHAEFNQKDDCSNASNFLLMGKALKSHLDQRIKTNRSNTHNRETHNSVTKTSCRIIKGVRKGFLRWGGAL